MDRLFKAASLSIFLLLNFSCSQTPAKRVSKIIVFGDSLTFGTGAKKSKSYPRNLAKLTGIKIANAGVPGNTVCQAEARLDAVLEKHGPADLVIATIGGNDITKRVPKENSYRCMNSILKKVKNKGASFLLLAIRPPFVNKKRLNKLEEIVEEHGQHVHEKIMKGFWLDKSLMADSIHPNAKGYKIMAERVYETLTYLNFQFESR